MRILLLSCVVAFSSAGNARSDELPEKYRATVSKGLGWLIKQQHKDGYWTANGGHYRTAMTGLAGIALLNEGSTPTEGKFAENIRRAVGWVVQQSERGGSHDGLIGNARQPSEAGRYMFGHAYAMLFLARVYGEIEDAELRKTVRDVLTRAVKFSANAQSSRGGWFYTSKLEGHDGDEGAATVTQLHALRELRNAGIAVPKVVLQQAHEYLKKSTTQKGGIVYSLGPDQAVVGGERPALTAAALACVFDGTNLQDLQCKRWFKYCRRAIPLDGAIRLGYDEYLHFYYAQAIFRLGDDGWKKMFPESAAAEELTWSGYRTARFDYLQKTQREDGSWTGTAFDVGPVYQTASHLATLQLDRTRTFELSR